MSNALPDAKDTGQDWTQVTQPGTSPKINSIFDFSSESLGQLKLWLEQSGLAIPITSILGFSQFTVQASDAIADVGASLAPGNSASGTGPTILNVGVGKYLVIVSYNSTSSAAYNPVLSATVGSTTISAYSIGPGNPSSPTFSVTKVGVAQMTTAGSITSAWSTGSNGFASNQSYGLSNMQIIALKYANK